ncbi:21275_t:CDS:2 [Rhizophagus irregularis]|nr:21275_t:CDS:2 [Rhizophagus irregularis]
MSPSRQQTTRNEATKETYDNMDSGEQQKNLSTPRSTTTFSTNTSSSPQAKVDPEVVRAAAQLFVLANQARNHGYLVDANSNVVDVTAANRSSAMSLSNLLLPDEANSSSKATNDASSLQDDGVHDHLREEFVKL